MKRNSKRRVIPLKKYNKIVSIIVKDYKKNNVVYNIKDVRKLASEVYKDFRQVSLSKIRIRDVKKSSEQEVRISAVDVPNYWFDAQSNFTYWFQVGEWVNRFANAYPNIPIMIITKSTEKNPLVVQGATGNYDGSVFQRWTEDIRDNLEEPDKSDAEIDVFLGTPAYKNSKGDIYAVWYEDGCKLPKVAPKPIEIEPRKKILIEESEKEEKKRRDIEKPPKKRGRPKLKEEDKKKPLPKVKKKKDSKKEPKDKDVNRITEIKNIIDGLRKDIETIKEEFKDDFITKSEAKKQIANIRTDISDLTKKFAKGGRT